ncbi:MAG TPA: DUF4407 domain-containing protein [Flavisolibacter sp.]|jgi:hypothetical protein|nr:DUF4407 domain-containing protein [Flavisolibacter sp.]
MAVPDTDHSTASGQEEDGIYTYDSFGRGKKSTESNFLWWCSGAHQRLLRQFPSEQIKYSGLGGVLLATFLLAALSSGYALYSVFGSVTWALVFALIWGFIIFNFDRFLVSTMRKYGVSKRRQLLMAVPRLLLALLIGLTIARPLELKLFEKEIAVKMVENTHKKIQRNDSLLHIENLAQTQSATLERERLMTRKLALEDTLNRLQAAYVQEADGTGGSGRRGIEKLTRLKMDAYQSAVQQYTPELVQLGAAMQQQDSILQYSKAGLEARRKDYETNALSNLGFLEKNKALSDLSAEENSVWWTSFLISLLIIIIEIGPVLSKLIMPLGPYDIALAREELLQMAADENEMRRGKDVVFEKKKAFYQKQRQLSNELVNKLTELQKKHIDEELDKWERGEWDAKDHRASMDEVMRKIRQKYQLGEEDVL